MSKLLLGLLLSILIPSYYQHYGIENFLWFSDIALFLIFLGVYSSSALLISIAGTLSLFSEINWCFDFFYNLFTGQNLLGMSNYMFDSQLSLFLRGLSLFHLLLPIYSIRYLYLWGYDHSSFKHSTVLYWIIIFVCYMFTEVDKNINWVHLPQLNSWQAISPTAWVLIQMTLYPLLVMLPTSLLFKKAFECSLKLRHSTSVECSSF